MTKVNQNNGNERKSDIFPWNIHFQIWHHFSLVAKYYDISMNFRTGICQFHYKVSTNKQREIKSNGTRASLTVFSPFYKVAKFEIYFLIRLISKMNDNSSGRKMSFIYFILWMLKEIAHILQRKITITS